MHFKFTLQKYCTSLHSHWQCSKCLVPHTLLPVSLKNCFFQMGEKGILHASLFLGDVSIFSMSTGDLYCFVSDLLCPLPICCCCCCYCWTLSFLLICSSFVHILLTTLTFGLCYACCYGNSSMKGFACIYCM